MSSYIFEFFNSNWGPYHVDRLLMFQTKRVSCFTLRFDAWKTAGVDEFAFDWSGVNNCLMPLVCVVPKVLRHLILNRAFDTLVVPKWQSAIFWPLLIDYVGYFQ